MTIIDKNRIDALWNASPKALRIGRDASDFSGRMRMRSYFFWFYGGLVLTGALSAGVDWFVQPDWHEFAEFFLFAGFVWLILPPTAQRYQDTDRSGHLALVFHVSNALGLYVLLLSGCIAFMGLDSVFELIFALAKLLIGLSFSFVSLSFLFLVFRLPSDGPNQFGPDPLEAIT